MIVDVILSRIKSGNYIMSESLTDSHKKMGTN